VRLTLPLSCKPAPHSDGTCGTPRAPTREWTGRRRAAVRSRRTSAPSGARAIKRRLVRSYGKLECPGYTHGKFASLLGMCRSPTVSVRQLRLKSVSVTNMPATTAAQAPMLNSREAVLHAGMLEPTSQIEPNLWSSRGCCLRQTHIDSARARCR